LTIDAQVIMIVRELI